LKGLGLDFPNSTHQYPSVLIKFPKNSHQIPLVPIKFPSKSFCSHGDGGQAGEHRWARRWMVRLVRDSGRVVNGAPQFVGRKGSHSGRQTSAACGRAESRDFPPARFCGRSRTHLLLARQSATLLPSCVRPKRSWLLEQLLQIWIWLPTCSMALRKRTRGAGENLIGSVDL
jgi:hypothetical protein